MSEQFSMLNKAAVQAPQTVEAERNSPKIGEAADALLATTEREKRLGVFVEQMRQELTPDELAKIDAIILFGSTAREQAKPDSDVDVFALGQLSRDLYKKLQALLTKNMGDIEALLLRGTSVNGAVALITGSRDELTAPVWKFLFITSDQKRDTIDSALRNYLAKKKSMPPIK